MSEHARSEQACPVCGQHTLALDQPPEIDVMGVQVYSDMLGMGDLPNLGSIGIVCLSCHTHWRDKEAFDRGEAELAAAPIDELSRSDPEATEDDDPEATEESDPA